MTPKQEKFLVEKYIRPMVKRMLKEEDDLPFVDDKFIKISEFKNRFRILSRLSQQMDEKIDGDISYEEFRKYISEVSSAINYIENSVKDRYRNS